MKIKKAVLAGAIFMTCFASSGYAADLLSATIVKASIYINNTNQTQSLDEPIKIYI